MKGFYRFKQCGVGLALSKIIQEVMMIILYEISSWNNLFLLLVVAVNAADGVKLREGDIAVSSRSEKSCFAQGCLWSRSVDGHIYIAYTLSSEYSKFGFIVHTHTQTHTRKQTKKTKHTLHHIFYIFFSWSGSSNDKTRYETDWEKHVCALCAQNTPKRLLGHSA